MRNGRSTGIKGWDGQRLRQVRQKKGLSQAQLAESVGVSGSYLSMLENGVREPSSGLVRLLCLLHGVNQRWLEEGQGGMLLPTAADSAGTASAVMAAGVAYDRPTLKAIILQVTQSARRFSPPAVSESQVELILDLYERSARKNSRQKRQLSSFYPELF